MPPKDAVSELQDKIFQNPRGLVQRVEQLCALRKRGTENTDLTRKLKLLQVALLKRELITPGSRAWPVFAGDGRVAGIYVGLVQSEGFLEENSMLVNSVFNGLADLANIYYETRGQEAERFLLPHIPAMIKALWVAALQDKELLSRHDSKDPEFEETFLLLRCMYELSGLYIRAYDKPVGLNTYFPHLSLFHWVQLDRLACAFFGNACLYAQADLGTCTDEDNDRFVREAILDGIGGDAVFKCFNRTLDNYGKDKNALAVLKMIAQVVRHESMRPLVYRHKLFKHVVAMLDHRFGTYEPSQENLTNMWREWGAVEPIFNVASHNWLSKPQEETTSSVQLRGQDMVEYLSYGAHLISKSAPEWSSRAYESLARNCRDNVRLLQTYCRRDTLPEHRAADTEYVAGLVRGARVKWIPTLDALRAGRRNLGELKEAYEELLAEWAQLGPSMGLDEDHERKSAFKFCSYRPCQYHQEHAPGALSVCKACKEVRYCSKECQRGDWKAHKPACGKRLK